ncbi:CBS domain-containing protein [Actinobacteria bacterium YIM 96077]|uniref:CBS domain-containing protein n=1 Tax=Phytoactinopolyspora halophila TaxID=1981511 RepID=A0A329QD41_9ACTN|nr:CBS domain-containing protein [Phytoactinopolyspora halophila]AYY14029.1 CBS domain-containing protein [Actinobacteria bacterium YIM 96077]RAW10280.1 CBS domain-containing protein [Phytoactinopolyspora halophila]
MAQKVSDVMTTGPTMVDANRTLAEIAEMMRDRGIGDVLVTEDGNLCGVVTDRDIVVRGLTRDGDTRSMRIGEICSRDLVSVDADSNVDDAVRLMRENTLRRLPVARDGQLVGVVSIGDLAVEEDRRSALADISAAPANG